MQGARQHREAVDVAVVESLQAVTVAQAALAYHALRAATTRAVTVLAVLVVAQVSQAVAEAAVEVVPAAEADDETVLH